MALAVELDNVLFFVESLPEIRNSKGETFEIIVDFQRTHNIEAKLEWESECNVARIYNKKRVYPLKLH